MTVNFGEFSGDSEQLRHEAPVLDIGEVSRAQIGRLELKLAEYATRDSASGVNEYTHPEMAFLLRGAEVFKKPVLDYVLGALQATGRDLKQQPVTLEEVATAIEQLFGIDLSASKTTDFLWNQDRPGTVRPDFEKLIENGTKYDPAFSEVYAIIRAYCIDQPQGIVGGTGLPELPSEASEGD